MDLTIDICKTINQKIFYVNTIFNEELENLGLTNKKIDVFNSITINISDDGLICGKIYYIVDILNYMKNLQITILDNNFSKLFKDLLMCELIHNSILKNDYSDFKNTKEYVCKLYLEIRAYTTLLLFNKFRMFDNDNDNDDNIIKIIVLLDKVSDFKKNIISVLLNKIKPMKKICDIYAKYEYFYKIIEKCPLNWNIQYEFYSEYANIVISYISTYFTNNEKLSYKKFKELTMMTLEFEKIYKVNPSISTFILNNYMSHYLEIKNNYYDEKINNLLDQNDNSVTLGVFNKACTLILIIKKIIKNTFCIIDQINSEKKIHQYIYQYENYINNKIKDFTIVECFIGLNSLEYINKNELKFIDIDKYCSNILHLKNITHDNIINIEMLNEDSNKYMILAYLFEKYKNNIVNTMSSYEDLVKIEIGKEEYLKYSTIFIENNYKIMWNKYISININYLQNLVKLFIVEPKNILSAIKNLDIAKHDILLIVHKVKMDIGMKNYIINQINKFYV
jgi:hypothetical protein